MCIECDMNRLYGVFLCVTDRKVWKGDSSCPTCGRAGRSMGWRWRAPRLSNKSAWKKIEAENYLWDKNAILAKAEKRREKRLDFGRADKERLAQRRAEAKAKRDKRLLEGGMP